MKILQHLHGFLPWHWLCGFATLLPASTMAQTTNSQLVINLSGLRNTKGQVLLAVHSQSQSFPDKVENALIRKNIPASQSAISIEKMVSGTYAISVIHDEDGDGDLDKNFIGIPTEGFGVSQNVRTMIGAPDFEDCQFELKTSPLQLNIKMRYL
jgi:uncharacterized protein (DUF2141 family)